MPLSSGNKISPAILFIIVILAIIFFISGLLHLLVRYLMKNRSSLSNSSRDPHEMSNSGAFQRQLQQLFNLHDSGLDQAFIDALPVFLYKDIMGLKEPFDCAVCLCEFLEEDKLRLLPLCSHAFHLSCIDTWLLSNSTCPLCRGVLFSPGFCVENPMFYFDDSRDDQLCGGGGGGGVVSEQNGHVVVGVSPCSKQHEEIDGTISSRRVFSVRLGKFKNTNNVLDIGKREMGETSNSNLDSRRCFSMGSFQYVVGDSELQVALCPNSGKNHGGQLSGVGKERSGHHGNYANDGDNCGKRINNRGESFSVSKIWLWSKKDKFHNSADNVSLPWTSDYRAHVV